jgi:hypothetical protein
MIPKEIHYLFGIDKNFCNKPFSYFHYLNVLSAIKINFDYKINLYYLYKPNSIYFDKLYDICNVVKLQEINYDIDFEYKEHIGDLVRLNIINQFGGIYIDLDTVCIKKFDDLLNNECVLGKEYGIIDNDTEESFIGLCNATIMSTKSNLFIKDWIQEYHSNYNKQWNYLSVVFPHRLINSKKYNVNIQDKNSFFKYSWDNQGKNQIFNLNSCIDDCYSLHLWETKNYDILSKYDDSLIKKTDNTICNIYKTLI